MSYDSRFWLESGGVSDSCEDSDGDGAFNIQELMIGKNPANPHDVLGIHLRVYVAPDIYRNITNILWGFLKASRYIFDYTDGHAFISLIEFVDREKKANVIVKDFGETNWAGVATLVPREGYWFGGYWFDTGEVLLNYYYLNSSINYFAAITGHELGHYVFGFFDEYEDANGNDYPDDLQEELSENNVCTVMGLGKLDPSKEIYYRELSTQRDYDILASLAQKYNVNPITEQLAYKDYPCWYTILYDMYIMCDLIFYLGGDVYVGPHDKVLYYTPLPGPFTMVEAYVKIIW